jgi:hypothetical protein
MEIMWGDLGRWCQNRRMGEGREVGRRGVREGDIG